MTLQFNEKGKFFTDIITKKPVLVKIQTTSHLIEGTTYTRPDERIIDELLNDNQFLAVTDAVIYDPNYEKLIDCKFLTLNKAHIIWIVPIEEDHQSTVPGVQD